MRTPDRPATAEPSPPSAWPPVCPGLAGRAAARSAPMLGRPPGRRRRRRGVCSSGVSCPGRLARRGGWRAGGTARARGSSASTPRRPGARRRALRPGPRLGRGVAVERAAATIAPGRGGAAGASWRDDPRDRHPPRAPPPLRPGCDGEPGWAPPPPGRLRGLPALAGIGPQGRAATRGRGAAAAGRAAAAAGAAGAAIGRTAAGPGQGAPAATGGATGPGGGPAAGAGAAETGRPASTPATAAAGAGTDTVDEGTRPSSSPAPARWTW